MTTVAGYGSNSECSMDCNMSDGSRDEAPRAKGNGREGNRRHEERNGQQSIEELLPLSELQNQMNITDAAQWRDNISKIVEFLELHVKIPDGVEEQDDPSKTNFLSSCIFSPMLHDALESAEEFPDTFDDIIRDVATDAVSIFPWTLLRFVIAIKTESVFSALTRRTNCSYLRPLRASLGKLWTVGLLDLPYQALMCLNVPLCQKIPPIADRLILTPVQLEILKASVCQNTTKYDQTIDFVLQNPGPPIEPPPPKPILPTEPSPVDDVIDSPRRFHARDHDPTKTPIMPKHQLSRRECWRARNHPRQSSATDDILSMDEPGSTNKSLNLNDDGEFFIDSNNFKNLEPAVVENKAAAAASSESESKEWSCVAGGMDLFGGAYFDSNEAGDNEEKLESDTNTEAMALLTKYLGRSTN